MYNLRERLIFMAIYLVARRSYLTGERVAGVGDKFKPGVMLQNYYLEEWIHSQ